MFAARGIAVSFSVFAAVYVTLSCAVGLTWRHFGFDVTRRSARRTADFLFALRMFPFVAAAAITVAFTVPSFLLLEPRAIDEPLGEVSLVLGLCGAALGVFGAANAVVALRRASHAVSTWTEDSRPAEANASVPVLRISRSVPAMTATGILRPRILLSGAAEFVLTENELRSAVSHEVAHIRRRDNLRKLLLRFVAFPGMRGLEAAWLEATEMAADDAAVSSTREALDLAAALIKLSRLGPAERAVDLTAALVQSPAAVMNARVERLITWTDRRQSGTATRSLWYGAGAGLVTLALFAVTYSELLVRVHTATEWLVR